MRISCPHCGCEEYVRPGVFRKTYSCLGCGKRVEVPGVPYLGLRVTSVVLVLLGVYVTLGGLLTPTSVRTYDSPEVVNLELLFRKLTATISGLLLVGLGVLVRILVAVQPPKNLR